MEEVATEDSQCCRCYILEERSKKAEAKIVELELEIEKRKSEYETGMTKFKELEVKKIAVEGELKAMRARPGEGKEQSSCVEDESKQIDRVIDLTEEEEDKVVQLMIENSVLECEKKKAEGEVEVWREKFKELELWVSQLDDSPVSRGLKQQSDGVIKGKGEPDVGTKMDQSPTKEKGVDLVDVGPSCNTPGMEINVVALADGKRGAYLEPQVESGRTVQKHLLFEEARTPTRKMAPSTPGGAKSACLGVINICDSDDESDISGIQMATHDDEGNGKVYISSDHALGGTVDCKKENISEASLKGAVCNQTYEEYMDDCEENTPYVTTPKRKRTAKIVTSDSESDEDDHIPISKLKRIHLQGSPDMKSCSTSANPCLNNEVKGTVTASRRRLVTLRHCEGKGNPERSSSSKTNEAKYQQAIPTTDDVEDSESEEVGSDSEGETLGGFIVESSDVSDGDDASGQPEDESDSNIEFDEILCRLQRSKDQKFKWEFEADMLSAFGKDAELCMKAVCALYRQQTSEEKFCKESFCSNSRGFSKFDALRGTDLAMFLTGGDPLGDLKKSVKELQEHDYKGVELCRTLATRYSKQLFEIYKNKEDPLFLPS